MQDQTQRKLSDKIVDVEVVGVEATVEQCAGNFLRHKLARMVVPGAPQFESKSVNCS